jgi:hypothetical protein
MESSIIACFTWSSETVVFAIAGRQRKPSASNVATADPRAKVIIIPALFKNILKIIAYLHPEATEIAF